MAKVARRGSTEATVDKEVVAPRNQTETGQKTKAVVGNDSPLIPFSRWFTSKGFKPHWRPGMVAYADTTGRRTAEEWDKLFGAY